MNDREQDLQPPRAAPTPPVPREGGEETLGNRGDLVMDLTGIKELGLATLSLLLTAQQQAEQEDRSVWLAGVPRHVWKALHAMGLGRLFKPFPASGEAAV